MPVRLLRSHTPKEREVIEKITKEINLVKETGNIVYGTQSTIRELQKGTPQIVLVARYGKRSTIKRLKYFCKISNVPSFMFPGDVRELGEACERPHVISALSILDPGASDILKLEEGTLIE